MPKNKKTLIRESTRVDSDFNFSNLIETLRLKEDEIKRRDKIIEESRAELSKLRESELSFKEQEISLLKYEVELLKQNQVRDKKPISFHEVSGTLPEFSGDDSYRVTKWLEDVENMAQLLKWEPLEKLVYGRKLLTGTAKLALRSRSGLDSWEKFKSFLLEEFVVVINSADAHKELSKQRKKADESYQAYYLKMREMGLKGNIEERAVIQYIIDGIHDSTANKVLLYGAKTFGELKEKLDLYAVVVPKASESSSKRPPKKPNDSCFNCGNTGHKARACPSKSLGPTCFSCGNHGHKASECPQKNSKRSSNTAISGRSTGLYKLIELEGNKVTALIDTGSDITLIRYDEYIRIGSPQIGNNSIDVRGIAASTLKTLGSFKSIISLDDDYFSVNIHVVPIEATDIKMIVGNDVLRGTQITITQNDIKVQKLEEELASCFNIQEKDVDKLTIGNTQYTAEVLRIAKSYKPLKTKTSNVKMNIVLKDETPICQYPRRLPLAEKNIVDEQVSEWLENGVIRPSNSDFASPIVLVNKKDGSKRLCIDYRRLNREIVKDRYPLPLIEDQIDELSSAKIFTTLDLANGFFHVPVVEESVKYTAFVTPSGHYEFLRVPFGLCNAPAVFQRFINNIFRELTLKRHVLVYMDDLIIPGKDEEECLDRLREVLNLAAEYGLEIKWGKCQFLCEVIEYLGYEICKGRIKPSKSKIIAVERFPTPKNIKGVQSFIGITSYFRKFIPNYSSIAKPLSDMMRGKKEFRWGEEEKNAFNSLKAILTSPPVLNIFRPNAETELHTDASKFGFGAVLLQRNTEDMRFHPVHYFSRKTTTTQERYCSYELEVLAIVAALKKLRVYLLGLDFKIVTDCAAFKATMRKKELAPRIAGWALLLEEYSYTLEHRSGNLMKHSDALSRNPAVMTLVSDVIQSIEAAQRKDEKLQAITTLLKREPYKDYFTEAGVLYKTGPNGEKLMCIPKSMQVEIIRRAHDQGHFATKKVEEIVKKEFYIPHLRGKIERVRQNCVQCILAERKGGKQEGFLHAIPKGDQPLTTYHIDHLGPLASTKKKYRYILSVIDSFTKFVWLYPCKSTGTEEVIQKLNIQKAVFGNPKRVVCDRATSYTSQAFRDYCEKERITRVSITTGVARSNGQIERVNRVIIPMLAKLSLNEPDLWYKNVSKVQMFINSCWQRSIARSPFEVMFGIHMRKPDDINLVELLEEEIEEAFDTDRKEIRSQAARRIQEIQNENRKQYNKRRKPALSYTAGDLVAIKKTQFGTHLKLFPKFLGPYKVTHSKGNERYEVEKIGEHEGPKRTSTSADFMKPWGNVDDASDSESDASVLDDDVPADT